MKKCDSRATNGLSKSRVAKILGASRKAQILVIGDLMLDHYVCGTVSRISPEAPVPVLAFDRESFMPGGAANVARNLASLGSPVGIAGYVGRDDAGRKLMRQLAAQQISASPCIQSQKYQTVTKTRLVAHQQQIVRLDRDPGSKPDDRLRRRLVRAIQNSIANTNAIIISDYAKGVISQDLLEELRRLAEEHDVFMAADPNSIIPGFHS